MIDDYTRILESVAELEDQAAADAAVTKIIMHLKSSGRTKMLSEIVRELKKVAARRAALSAHVEVAHEKDSAAALHAASVVGISAKKAVVNHSLIQGWRARGNGMLVDHSAKRALVDIYQKVTA